MEISTHSENREKSISRIRIEKTFREPLFLVGLLILFFWILMALFGAQIHQYTYAETFGTPWTKPDSQYWFGLDRMGRDIFTRIAVGARLMLALPLIAVTIGVVIGTTIGLVTGYVGGLLDEMVMRFLDIVMAFPMFMLYLLVIVAIGASAVNVIWAIAIGATPGIARLVRGMTIDIGNREFILAARMRGESAIHIMFAEILPNITGTILVDACIRIAFAMFATGGLGFLGLGVPPPYPDWGIMVSEARTWVFVAPWAPLPPIIAIASLIISFNLIADGLRKAGWTD